MKQIDTGEDWDLGKGLWEERQDSIHVSKGAIDIGWGLTSYLPPIRNRNTAWANWKAKHLKKGMWKKYGHGMLVCIKKWFVL